MSFEVGAKVVYDGKDADVVNEIFLPGFTGTVVEDVFEIPVVGPYVVVEFDNGMTQLVNPVNLAPVA